MPGADLLDSVNEQDQPIGTVSRANVFKVHANFRVAHVFIFNHTGELLLSRTDLPQSDATRNSSAPMPQLSL